jgi:hypothetical protein
MKGRQVFSHSVGYFFTQLFPLLSKVFWFDVIFAFVFCTSGSYLKNYRLYKCFKIVSPMFSSSSFRISCLKYLSLWSILSWFLYRGSDRGQVSVFYRWISGFPTTILKWLSLPLLHVSVAFVEKKLAIDIWVYFWDVRSISLVLCCLFLFCI